MGWAMRIARAIPPLNWMRRGRGWERVASGGILWRCGRRKTVGALLECPHLRIEMWAPGIGPDCVGGGAMRWGPKALVALSWSCSVKPQPIANPCQATTWKWRRSLVNQLK
jgi:hypothetical protein